MERLRLLKRLQLLLHAVHGLADTRPHQQSQLLRVGCCCCGHAADGAAAAGAGGVRGRRRGGIRWRRRETRTRNQ